MIGAAQHKKHKKIPTIMLVTCPACEKKRLGKYVQPDGTLPEVLTETVTVRDEVRYLDVCSACTDRYRKADERFVLSNMRKLAQAARSAKSDKGSDHTDFSLN